jgi:hypothetical protein
MNNAGATFFNYKALFQDFFGVVTINKTQIVFNFGCIRCRSKFSRGIQDFSHSSFPVVPGKNSLPDKSMISNKAMPLLEDFFF